MALSFDDIAFGKSQISQTRPKIILERVLHFLAYHFILSRRSTRHVRVAGLELTVGPTVFDPRFFLTSEFFAEFILGLDLRGKRVADVGTGSGILAIAAAKAGASEVVAIDINPYAVAATNENAKKNGVAGTVRAIIGHLLSPVPAGARFDLILTNPPFFDGQPRDVADRAWYAGPNFRDIATLFDQASQRLAPGGRVYVVLSSSCNLAAFAEMIEKAGMIGHPVSKKSFMLESIIVYELRRLADAGASYGSERSPSVVEL
jgi:release factor glutamine methyltransferase